MTGRLLFVYRLLVRDLRRRPTETVLLLLAITAATATTTLGLALDEIVTRPYEKTRAATAGPDLVLEPAQTGQEALDALAPLTTTPGVTGHGGPYPLAFLALTSRETTMRVIVEGRDGAPAAVDQPAMTDGTWVRPGGVVVERSFADALDMHTGDMVSVDGHPLRVVGIAVTAARPVYPFAGWHIPGTVLTDSGGLVWVHRADIAALAGEQRLAYTLNLKLADPQAVDAFLDGPGVPANLRGWQVRTWQGVADRISEQNARAQQVLMVGTWLLTALAVAGVAGIVAGRVIGQRRRVGLLKAVGAGPAMVAAVHLTEYLVIGLAAAGLGLAAGWLAAPPLFSQSAGLVGAVGVDPPLRTAVAATVLALAIAVAATLVPVVRAATTSTVHALADAATPPRRRPSRIRVSRRLPSALLIGLRINARRPHRARLVTVNTFITAAALAALLMTLAIDPRESLLHDSALPNPRDERVMQATLVIAGVVCVLALLNTITSTWITVLHARQPLAIARTLGATPSQAGMGLAVAQILPATVGVATGIPFGIELFRFFERGDPHDPPNSWLVAAALGVVLVVAALAAIPALAVARRPVADILPSV